LIVHGYSFREVQIGWNLIRQLFEKIVPDDFGCDLLLNLCSHVLEWVSQMAYSFSAADECGLDLCRGAARFYERKSANNSARLFALHARVKRGFNEALN